MGDSLQVQAKLDNSIHSGLDKTNEVVHIEVEKAARLAKFGERSQGDPIEMRVKSATSYMIETGGTIKETARELKVSKSTIQRDLTKAPEYFNGEQIGVLRSIMNNNYAERFIRAKRNYKKMVIERASKKIKKLHKYLKKGYSLCEAAVLANVSKTSATRYTSSWIISIGLKELYDEMRPILEANKNGDEERAIDEIRFLVTLEKPSVSRVARQFKVDNKTVKNDIEKRFFKIILKLEEKLNVETDEKAKAILTSKLEELRELGEKLQPVLVLLEQNKTPTLEDITPRILKIARFVADNPKIPHRQVARILNVDDSIISRDLGEKRLGKLAEILEEARLLYEKVGKLNN